MSQLLVKDGPKGTAGAASVTGWTDYSKPTPDKPAVLLLNGRVSHKTLDAVEFCQSNNITLLGVPPHTTHKLQP